MTHRGPFQPLPFCDSVKHNPSLSLAVPEGWRGHTARLPQNVTGWKGPPWVIVISPRCPLRAIKPRCPFHGSQGEAEDPHRRAACREPKNARSSKASSPKGHLVFL